MGIKNFPSFLAGIIFAGLIFSAKNVAAQGYYFYNNGYYESQTVIELGFAAGAMNGMTDIGGSKKGKANAGFLNDFTFQKTKFSGGIYLAGTYKDFVALRVQANFGKVEAADSNLKGTTNKFAEGRYDRNLSFRSNIFELGAAVELHPLFIRDYIDNEPPRLSPYVFAGVGFTRFNPQANLNGTWHDLEPLRLEGEGFSQYPDRRPWKKTALSFPIGIGLRYELSQLFTLRFELARHFLATDYLDGVSQKGWVDPATFYTNLPLQQANIAYQLYNRATKPSLNPRVNDNHPRGNPEDNDAFWSIMFKIGINLNRQKI